MLQATVDRLGDLVSPERMLIATTAELAGPIALQLSYLPRQSLLCEPCPRNTAPCIALAAIRILRDDPDAVMAVMPADQVIEPPDAFQQAIRIAVALVEERPARLVTFGIRPTYPAESFGYIERGDPLLPVESLEHRPQAFSVKQFREKPSAATAREYLAAGTFYWNAGIFVWKARTVWDALARYEPSMFKHLQAIADAAGTEQFTDILKKEFSAIEGKSIDYAVMERHDDVAVIEAPFQWDDVGSWRAMERLQQPDAQGNILGSQRHLAMNSRGTIIRSSDPRHLVAVLGVKDIIVVATPDATLVADKNDEESVRLVIQELKRRGWDEYL
jgi:mannose-1-phosphate guanylyltransferase